MNTIDTSSTVFIHCNLCHDKTHHVSHGECRKTDRYYDEASRTEINFDETFTLLQCQVCGQGRLQVVMWNSENEHCAPNLFPPSECRRPPEWFNELPPALRVQLKDVYAALDAGMYAIALMGVRAVLDVWVSDQTTSENNFPKKLADLANLGTLSARQVEILKDVFEAGSAATHRGYSPSLLDSLAATEAVENLLHQHVLVPRVEAMKSNTPPRERK